MIMTAPGFELVWVQSLQVSLVAGVVWLITRIWATDRPHLAHALWAVVLVKCLVPPLWSPTGIFSWMGKSALTPSLLTTELDTAYRPPSDTLDQQPIVIALHGNNRHADADKVEIPTHDKSALAYWHSTIRYIHTVFPPIWVAGVLLSSFWIAVRYSCFLWTIRTAKRVYRPDLCEATRQLCKRLGIRRCVRVKIIECPIGPAVIGWLRPTILLPRLIIDGKSASQLQPLLAHELVHVRRGDLIWALLQIIATRLWWFHPLVWLATRMTTREAERSCDEETIAELSCSPAIYARELLEVLERKHLLRVAPALPGVRPVDITKNRLERIMRLGHGSHRRTPWSVRAIALIAGCLLLPGATRLVAQQDPSKAQPSVQAAKGANGIDAIDPQIDAVHEKPSLSLQIRFITLSSEDFDKLNIEWTLAESSLGSNTIDASSAASTPSSRLDASVVSASVIEQNSPVLYSILTEANTKSMLELVQGQSKTNVLQAPRVLLNDGQQGWIQDIAQRPFIVGLKKVQEGDAIAPQPVIRVVDCGTKIGVRPLLGDKNNVHLQLDLILTAVRTVEMIEVRLSGKSKASLQAPEVAKTTVQCELDVPLNQTLILSGAHGKPRSQLLVMVTCQPTFSSRPEIREASVNLPEVEPRSRRVVLGGSVNSDLGLAGQYLERLPMVQDVTQGDQENPVSILGPHRSAVPIDNTVPGDSTVASACIDPPWDDEIMAVVEKVWPSPKTALGAKQALNNIRIVKERVKDYQDPLRFVPLIGYAKLHHTLYKCTIYFESTIYTEKSPGEYVLYVDHNHFEIQAEPKDSPRR